MSFPRVVDVKTTVTTSLKFTFKDFGPVATGTIDLQSQYECAPNPDACPSPVSGLNMMSCTAQLTFVARQVDVTELTAFTP